MEIGKVPENVLKRSVFKKLTVKRPEVLVHAGVGEDAEGAGHIVELAAAHALFLQVDHLEFDAPLLEIALGLFGIKALCGAKNLNVHRSLSS